MTAFENDAILLLDSNRGIYIPRDFANEIKRECVDGVSDDDWRVLEAGPDHEWYWEAWNDVENNAIVTDPSNGIRYRIYQDGDCFLVPEDCEIPES